MVYALTDIHNYFAPVNYLCAFCTNKPGPRIGEHPEYKKNRSLLNLHTSRAIREAKAPWPPLSAHLCLLRIHVSVVLVQVIVLRLLQINFFCLVLLMVYGGHRSFVPSIVASFLSLKGGILQARTLSWTARRGSKDVACLRIFFFRCSTLDEEAGILFTESSLNKEGFSFNDTYASPMIPWSQFEWFESLN